MAVAALLLSVTADLVFMAQAGSEFRTLQQQHWEAGESSSEDMALLGATAGAGVFLAVLQILSTMIGIVGLILGIVATVRGSFRSAAVTAIVVAGAAPIISFIVFSLILEAP
jgi:UPF0716 family protein affecting phage T7 exclusion